MGYACGGTLLRTRTATTVITATLTTRTRRRRTTVTLTAYVKVLGDALEVAQRDAA